MGLTNLLELHLGQNLISDLLQNTFIRNKNLEKLFLFSNNLEELKEKSFNGLVSLTSLLINNNILKEISPKIFIYTPSLQKLYVFWFFKVFIILTKYLALKWISFYYFCFMLSCLCIETRYVCFFAFIF